MMQFLLLGVQTEVGIPIEIWRSWGGGSSANPISLSPASSRDILAARALALLGGVGIVLTLILLDVYPGCCRDGDGSEKQLLVGVEHEEITANPSLLLLFHAGKGPAQKSWKNTTNKNDKMRTMIQR
mmetsp:Transcript_50448/g.107119  ORF Transcript_50448/g.107119 Transcript_50448/m.107119 type:complete len:127 (+) Transcript_50448:1652-2032(+)